MHKLRIFEDLPRSSKNFLGSFLPPAHRLVQGLGLIETTLRPLDQPMLSFSSWNVEMFFYSIQRVSKKKIINLENAKKESQKKFVA